MSPDKLLCKISAANICAWCYKEKCNKCIRDHPDKSFYPTALCSSVSLCSMRRVYGIARWKTDMIWCSQTLLWVSDATVFVQMHLSHALTDPLKIKASLLLFQLLMDWNNMNGHEIPSFLIIPCLHWGQDKSCVIFYCINNATLLLMFNIPQYEGRKSRTNVSEMKVWPSCRIRALPNSLFCL